MSDPITIYFGLEEGASIDDVKRTIEQGLAPIDEIKESDVQVSDQRLTGVEVAAMIGAVIVVAEGAGKLVDTSTELVKKLTELVHSIKGLKSAIVETPDGPKELEEMTAADIAALAQQSQ